MIPTRFINVSLLKVLLTTFVDMFLELISMRYSGKSLVSDGWYSAGIRLPFMNSKLS